MDSQQQYNAFLADVQASTKKFTLKRSSLKGLIEELESQIRKFTESATAPTRFTDVVAARAYCKKPSDSRLVKYTPAIQRLVSCWGTHAHYPPIPVSPLQLINAVRTKLDECRNFACNDATTFAGDINPDVDANAILDLARKGGMPVSMPTAPSILPHWRATHVKNVCNSVYEKKSGECTSFGKAAAHILTTTPIPGPRPRVELVSWEQRTTKEVTTASGRTYNKVTAVAHVFCVVNRIGGTSTRTVGPREREKLPPFSDWGNECWIVDPWLASLGWNSCYSLQDYPKKGFLEPCYLEMDSTFIEE
jgi:hypothetical protein